MDLIYAFFFLLNLMRNFNYTIFSSFEIAILSVFLLVYLAFYFFTLFCKITDVKLFSFSFAFSYYTALVCILEIYAFIFY